VLHEGPAELTGDRLISGTGVKMQQMRHKISFPGQDNPRVR
jgi:hypothetical protein